MTAVLPLLIVAASAAVEAVSDGVPKSRVRLLPMGDVQLRDARGAFILRDATHAAAVVAATRQRAGAADIMIDYDHQSLSTASEAEPRAGARALAAGWIKPSSLSVEADGIWGDMEWTAAAQQHLAAREYRYISPLFFANRATREVVAIQNVALTNTPAITALDAVAASLNPDYLAANSGRGTNQTETDMDLSKIAVAAGLPATATESEIVAKAAALAASYTGLLTAAASIGLGVDATAEQLVAAAARPDPAKYVPIAVVEDLQKSVAALQKADADSKAEQLVAAAMQSGKVSPAMKDWATDYAQKDAAGFEAYLAKAPVLVAAGAQFDALNLQPGEGAHGLTADELKVAASMNLSAEEFAAAKKEG